MPSPSSFISRVSQALGRSSVPQSIPPPPRLDEPIIRLVHAQIGLPELFCKTAEAAKIGVSAVRVDELFDRLVAFLRERAVRTVGHSSRDLLDQLELPARLAAAGFECTPWDRLDRSTLYALDCGLTSAWRAVAETGSIVIRSGPTHGRSLSLVPPLHVCVLEPSVFVPDLLDLTREISNAGHNPGVVLITGPSKTADIEMNLVTGVHGPGEVHAFVFS